MEQGSEQQSSMPAIEIGGLAVNGNKLSRDAATESIEAERADYVETAIEDMGDPRLRAIAAEALNREFDYKMCRIQRALSEGPEKRTAQL